MYESGADAMLEGLKKESYKCHRHDLQAWHEGYRCCTNVNGGILVFIPIKEQETTLKDYGRRVFLSKEVE